MTYTTDSTGQALVSKSHHYELITPDTPRGKIVIMANIRARRAQVGVLSHKDTYWTHWAPCPTFKDEE